MKTDDERFDEWIKENDYRNICVFLLQLPNNSDFVSYYRIIDNSSVNDFIKIMKQNICDPKVLLVVKTLTLFMQKKELIINNAKKYLSQLTPVNIDSKSIQ